MRGKVLADFVRSNFNSYEFEVISSFSMRGKGFEPLKALSHLVLSQVRLTAPASPRVNRGLRTVLKVSFL